MSKGKYAEKARSRVDAETRYQLAVIESNHLRADLHELRKVQQENAVLHERLADLRERVRINSSDEVQRWETKAEYWRLATQVAEANTHLSVAIGRTLAERVLDRLHAFKREGATAAEWQELIEEVLLSLAGEWVDQPGGMDGLEVGNRSRAEWLIRAKGTRSDRRKQLKRENEKLQALVDKQKQCAEALKRWVEGTE